MTRLVDNLLFAVFTVIYFFILTKIVSFFTSGLPVSVASVMDIFGLLAALIIAFVLANLTAKKIKEAYQK